MPDLMQAVDDLRAVSARFRAGDRDAAFSTATVLQAVGVMLSAWPRAEQDAEGDDAVLVALAVAELYWCRDAGSANAAEKRALSDLLTYANRARPGLLPDATRSDSDAPAAPARVLAERAWASHTALLHELWRTTQDHELLDGAVALGRALAYGKSVSEQALGGHLADLAAMLRDRYLLAGRTADLDEGVSALREARTRIRGNPFLDNNLSELLNAAFQRDGDTSKLDEAVEVLVVALDTEQGSLSAVLHYNLGTLLLTRYRVLGRAADLDGAVAWIDRAVGAAEAGDPDLPDFLAARCEIGLEDSARTGAFAVLDRSVEAARKALALTPGGPKAQERSLLLVKALRARFRAVGVRRDLDEAVSVARSAVATTAAAGRSPAAGQTCLSMALVAAYTSAGDHDALDEALRLAQAAVGATSEKDRELADRTSLLGLVLRLRYERDGRKADLDSAVEAARKSAVEADAARRGRIAAGHLSQLCFALRLRCLRTHDETDAVEAIEAGSRAAELVVPGVPEFAVVHANLASAFSARYGLTRRPQDLHRAIVMCERAVEATPPGHAGHADNASNLSLLLMQRYALTGSAADLDAASDAARSAVRSAVHLGIPPGIHAAALGRVHAAEFARSKDRRSAEHAMDMLRDAATEKRLPSLARATAARQWGEIACATGQWGQAVDGFDVALEQLRLRAWLGNQRDDLLAAAAELVGLAEQAAAAAIEAGLLPRAVAFLESGRGLLHSHATGLHRDRDTLLEKAPELVARMDRLRAEFDHPPATESAAMPLISPLLSNRWDELLTEARGLPGMHDFLRPPQTDLPLRIGAGGPVVIINLSGLRCDAIVSDAKGLRLVPLKGLSVRSAAAHMRSLLAAQRSASLSPEHRLSADRTAANELAWTWDTIVDPVLTDLGLDGSRPTAEDDVALPRLWWCPTGLAQFLPLHAAGYVTDAAGPATGRPRRLVTDRVVCSYTPTLRALDLARRKTPPPHDAPLLAACVPNAPGFRSLRYSNEEVAAIRSHHRPVTLLPPTQATRERVLAELGTHPFFHFIGHGAQDPFRSGGAALYTSDHFQVGPVTGADFARQRLDSAHLAFLSACETARGEVQLPDEALHIAGALQLSGFTHVVGTQWSVDDACGPEIAGLFYQSYAARATGPDARAEMYDRHGLVARSLHRAVADLRESNPALVLSWAPYIHVGP
jgi:hypothetical protein